jgi:XRE family aerobic/anaerobic benzoate catabolism transcriptional regulator
MPAREACRLNDIRVRFGATLREWRGRRHLTQEQLAEASGLSYKFIGEVERGRGNPTLDTVARLADALDVSVSELMGEAERQRSPAAEYRISKRDLQVVREAVASIGELVETITSPPYRLKPRRKRS